ncbi:hypothetical protein BDR26DRAFT_675164 [Obelidium mucronatum]|nr:hypothetical protein BDR26DRAFT_675164 [Obelidium mucronatum]
MLVERSRLLTAQEIKISSLETKVEKLKDKLANAGERIQEREAHITELRIDVARNDLRNGEGFTEYDSKTRQLVRKREGEAMKSAQEVINSLQRQLSKKDELVERYREIIKDRRKDMAIKEENEQAEIRNLTEVINSLSDRQVSKLKNPHEVPQNLLSANKDLESHTEAIQEMESLLKIKDEELANLRSKYSNLKQAHKHHLETSETEIHHLRHELSIRNASHHEYETQIEALKRDLHLNEKELALAAEAAEEIQKSRGLQDHISKLNREIQKRDAKIGNMKDAIAQLKDTLIKTAESVAETRIRESNENLASNANDMGVTDMKRISHLESQVSKLTKTIEAHKKSEKSLQESILKVTFELDKKERLIEKLQEQNKDAQKALKKLAHESREKERDKEGHSRSGSSRMQPDGRGDHNNESDKGKRFAKLVEEEKKHAADMAKERWESEKKLQKKAELMKSKLNEKTNELNEAISREKSLKDSLSRLQAENSKLQKKLSALSGLPSAAIAALEAQHQHHRREQESQKQRHSDATSASWRESETSYASGSSRPSDTTASTRTTTSTQRTEDDDANLNLSPDDPDLTPEEACIRRRLVKTLDSLNKLQRENCELEKSVDHWKRVAEVERLKEVKELKRANKRLKEELEELENDGSSRKTSKASDSDDENSSNEREEKQNIKKGKADDLGFDRTAKKGEKSAHVVPMLESRIKDLLQRIQDVEDEKFKVEQTLVEVKFDKEKAIAEAERMERRAADMEDSMRAQKRKMN